MLLKAGFGGRSIILHGNAKAESELRAAADVGARVVVDNFDELERLERLAAPLEIYVRVTPHREFALIREGNIAAAFSLGGAVLGFVIPLGAAVRSSVNLADMAIWGLIALAVQIAAFVVVLIMLVVKPNGLFGERLAKKV